MLVSCSAPVETETIANNSIDATATTTPETEADPYEGFDLDGMELRFLNTEGKLWDTMSILDYEELSGVSIEDAVFNRNRTLEDKLNMLISVDAVADYQTALSKTVTAAEDRYDVAYTMSDSLASNITAGMFQNLNTIDTLPLDKIWWEPSFNSIMKLENQYLFAVGSSLHLMALDMTVACYANKDMLTNYGVELPYDTVREDKWTYDAMYEVMTPCVQLNGDEAFTKDPKNATFGVATFDGWVGVMVTTPDQMVQIDDHGTPYWNGATEKMLTAFSAMEKLFAEDGYMIASTSSMNYYDWFVQEKAAFCILSIGNASIFRNMDSPYGILPIPKYLETDDYSSPIGSTLLMSIPVTCANTENVGIALDAMTRYSYENVLPVYYESLCYKSLRDEDSIDMLEIIHAARTADLGRVYGWTTSLLSSIANSIIKRSGDYASTFAKNEEKLTTTIANSLEAMAKSWN